MKNSSQCSVHCSVNLLWNIKTSPSHTAVCMQDPAPIFRTLLCVKVSDAERDEISLRC